MTVTPFRSSHSHSKATTVPLETIQPNMRNTNTSTLIHMHTIMGLPARLSRSRRSTRSFSISSRGTAGKQ
jgi:hypothetical protein